MTTPEDATRPRTVVVAGASGLLGRPLVRHLLRRGDDVRLLVRRPASSAHEVVWDPSGGVLDPKALDGVDAVVNLGGANLGAKRWTDGFKAEILRSRLDGTSLLATTAARCEHPPVRFVQASAIGFYGDRGDEVVDESSAGGDGFLADVVRQWEAATAPARDAGTSVVHLRSGLVLTPSGGAAERLLPLFRLGLGGRLGSGRQWWSWITLPDEIRAILHLLDSSVTGPVNLTAPEPARNVEVTRALARALHRPAILPVPGFALRIVLGEFAGDILGSLRIVPSALAADGFVHRHRTIDDAAAWLVS
ncbi:MAG TPA: TIGR01777 family oxidoreductase [Actinotalea sp.]|nr:TIGR01777 family oxidoreductase [Actinotalea sp.]